MSFHTSSWMPCSNRSQRVGVLARYIAWENLPSLRLSLVTYVRYTRESEGFPLLLAGRCHPIICGPVLMDDTDTFCGARRDLRVGMRFVIMVQVVVVMLLCFHCHDDMRLAETGRLHRIPIRAITIRTRSRNTCVCLRHPDTVNRGLYRDVWIAAIA